MQLTHRNLGEVFFRAYEVDLKAWIDQSKDYSLLPDGNEIRAIIANKTPAASWTTPLPATPDFKSHRTFVIPPLPSVGHYVVVASAKKDFSASLNRMLAVNLLITDLAIAVRDFHDGSREVTVVSGSSGKPVAEARVSLYQYDYQKKHSVVETTFTSPDGTALLKWDSKKERGSHFMLAEAKGQQTLFLGGIGFYRGGEPAPVLSTLVYSDRSIYRPTQKIQWKVIAFGGSARRATKRNLKLK